MKSINKKYQIAALWFILHVLISSINDSIASFLSFSKIPSFEIVSLRFFFSTITLFLIMIPSGLSSFKTNHLKLHVSRSLLLFIAISIWVICLGKIPIITVTLMTFTIPVFFIILSFFFLKEKICLKRLFITITCFIGILIALNPTSKNFDYFSLLLLLAVICFAMLDVINKKYVTKEKITNMLFYSSFFTFLLSLTSFAWQDFIIPSLNEIMLSFILGAGSNLILYSFLKALSLVEATSLAPLRYVELVFSGILSYFLFGQIPAINFYLASFIIISCNLLLLYNESKNNKE